MNKTIQTVESAASAGAFRIEDVYPAVDGGRFPVKRIAGERVDVWADILRNSRDVTRADLLWRCEPDREWQRAPMRHHSNDRWVASFVPAEAGSYSYTIEAWTDDFATWRRDVELRRQSGADVTVDGVEGAGLLARAHGADQDDAALILRHCEDYLESGDVGTLLAPDLLRAMADTQVRSGLTRSAQFPLVADRDKAGFSAWYQMMPRSQATSAGRHGTLRDCIARVADIAAMGFDVLYLMPIHPIGVTRRKGRHDAPVAAPGDPGSPYAVGSADGGHDALHPALGTIEDMRVLVATCLEHDIEIALDFGVQCSPDHPWLDRHPDWFKRRPDGSMRPEGPSGAYRDIVMPDFECADRAALWNAFRDVMLFWIDQGVTIFAVDVHDTTPLAFWEWLIADIRRRHPDVILLSKTSTRPKLMRSLAKLGFAQSFSYFPWCTLKWELEQHLDELTRHPEREFCRPNLFTSTPDVLPFHLQGGDAWMFKSRLALAATLSGNYGIYNGYELLEHAAIPGREDHFDSEKYTVTFRDWEKPGNIKAYIAGINRMRSENPALQQTSNLRFVPCDDDGVIAFVKDAPERGNMVLVAVALASHDHEVWLRLGDVTRDVDGQRRPIIALENLATGEHRSITWGGVHVRIEPSRDPALLFRCLA